MVTKTSVLAILVLCLTIFSGATRADSVSISNPSFETSGTLGVGCGTGCNYNSGPIPGWGSTGTGGSWQPGSYFSSIPDGSLIAYTNVGTIYQTLAASVDPNSTYTLTVYVGDRTDGFTGAYTLALDTTQGGVLTNLCTITGNGNTISRGTFQAESCTYQSNGSVPGGDLYLLFTSLGGQLDVDNVSLTFVDPPSAQVPEPSSVSLLGTGLFLAAILFFRKRGEFALSA